MNVIRKLFIRSLFFFNFTRNSCELADCDILKIMYVGVDCHNPQNEMAGNTISIFWNDYTSKKLKYSRCCGIYSIKVNKEISHDHIHIIDSRSFGRVGQFFKLFTHIITNSYNGRLIVHFVGNGNQSLIFLFWFLNVFFSIPVIYTLLAKVKFKFMPKTINFIAPDQSFKKNIRVIDDVIPPSSPFEYVANESTSLSTIAFASIPKKECEFHEAGVYLIKSIALKLPNINFVILNRFDYQTDVLSKLFDKCNNVKLETEIIKNPKDKYMEYDSFIIPYIVEGRAEMPMSIIEALSLGKPVLVSNTVSLSRYIEKYQCGTTFSPNLLSCVEAINKLNRNYQFFSNNTRLVYTKEFCRDSFIESYNSLYKRAGDRYVKNSS